MKMFRPFAAALAITLMLPTLALAAPVNPILPGEGLTPSDTGGGREPKPDETKPDETKPDDSAPETGTSLKPSGKPRSNRDSSDFGEIEIDEQPTLQTRHFGASYELSCKVASNANDLVVVNHSADPLPPGTRIKWQLKAEGKRGFFAIIGELGGGQTLVADDVLDGKDGQNAECVARVI